MACGGSSEEPRLLQGCLWGEAAVHEEGHHVPQLPRILLQRGQAARAGTRLVLPELGTARPGDTRRKLTGPESRWPLTMHF